MREAVIGIFDRSGTAVRYVPADPCVYGCGEVCGNCQELWGRRAVPAGCADVFGYSIHMGRRAFCAGRIQETRGGIWDGYRAAAYVPAADGRGYCGCVWAVHGEAGKYGIVCVRDGTFPSLEQYAARGSVHGKF